MLHPQRARLLRFSAFEFDLDRGDLWKAGRRVRLQNQPRQVLRILVARRGELVTREELRRELWAEETFVDFDNGLNVAIRKIRNALGDAAPLPRFIETERAHGYRFIAPVSEGPAHPADSTGDAAPPPIPPEKLSGPPPGHPAAKRGRWYVVPATVGVVLLVVSAWFWGAGALPPASAVRSTAAPVSIAVLPLESGGDDAVEELLAAGIGDAIVTRLASVRRFRVLPATGQRGRATDPRQVARDFGAEYVLAGTIRATADRVRVAVWLLDVAGGSQAWGGRYDVARGDMAGVENAVAQEIATALNLSLSKFERERVYRRYTRSGAAYEHYLMGRARLRLATERDTYRAIAEFEAARDLDPTFAPAFAGLASAAAQLRIRFAAATDAAVWDARAREEARRALQLDPDLAEAHVALSAVHRFQGYDWATVIEESRRAIDLNPGLDAPHLHLATAYFHLGLLDEADAAVAAAQRLNPESRTERLEILGAISLFDGRIADAVGHLTQADHLSDSRIARYLLGWALYYQGDTERAETVLASMIGEPGAVPANARATLAALRAARGATDDARALAGRVAAEADLIHHAAYGLGTAYAQLRDPAAALRWLSQAAATGFACYPWYARDPLLDPIRDDANVSAFLRDLRRSWEDSRTRYAGATLASVW